MPDFEQMERKVLAAMKRAGWRVQKAPRGQKGFDLTGWKAGRKIAVQVKDFKVRVQPRHLYSFFDFIESKEASGFAYGAFITSSSYTPEAIAWYNELASPRLKLASFDGETVQWEPPPRSNPDARKLDSCLYVGVFTAKGGVGKTTVSAHLAGAMALSGYPVALVDLDPQCNLKNLLGEGLSIRQTEGHTVPLSVYTMDEWYARQSDSTFSIAICDCSPRFDANPPELVAKFSYCLIPTTLNPLGLNKNGLVITETFRYLRSVNSDAYVFVLANNHIEDTTKRAERIYEAYLQLFDSLSLEGDRFEIIHPNEAAIRHSKDLFYWGDYLYTTGNRTLAFQPRGGRCRPKEDFLSLLCYLEDRTGISPVMPAERLQPA